MRRYRTLVGHDATLPQGAHPFSALIWTRVTTDVELRTSLGTHFYEMPTNQAFERVAPPGSPHETRNVDGAPTPRIPHRAGEQSLATFEREQKDEGTSRIHPAAQQ